MVVGTRQSFKFFKKKKNKAFLGIKEDGLNLGIGFWITWLVLLNYEKVNL